MNEESDKVMKKRNEAFHPLTKTGGVSVDEVEELSSRISELERKADEINQSFEKFEFRSDKSATFMMALVVGIAVVSVVALIPISLDYLKNNAERFEKSMTEIQNVETRFENNFYSKDELEGYMQQTEESSDVLDCIKYRGFSMTCFE